jgi:hypothetical protein
VATYGQGWARAAVLRCALQRRCVLQRSAEAQGFGMRRSAEAQSFLDPLLRAAARGLNGQRCSSKERGKKFALFCLDFEKKKEPIYNFFNRIFQQTAVPLQRLCF